MKKSKTEQIRDIRNPFKLKNEDENYYKPKRIGNFYSKNYIEYEGNSDRNKTLSIKEYLDKIRSYLKDIINNCKKSDTWNIQLTITINFKDTNEQCLMPSKSANIEIMINNKEYELLEETLQSLLSRY